MFDSPYLRRESRYSRYFTAIDSRPIRLQGDQKSLVYGWKCPHYRRSNLGITRYTTLVVRWTMFESPYLGSLTSELQNFAAVHRTFCVHQMCEKNTTIDLSEVCRFRGQITGKNQNSRNFPARDHVWLPISRLWIEIFQIFYSGR